MKKRMVIVSFILVVLLFGFSSAFAEDQDALTELMKSRHSVNKFQRGVTLPEEELKGMLSLASTAPSAWNLQHWRYLLITSEEMKSRVLPIAYNQRQVADSSATVVILGDLEANKVARDVYGQALANGYMSQKVHDTLINQIEDAYAKGPQFQRDEAILNASLAAMQFMLVAKAKGYDTCALGGFDHQELIRELAIPPRYIPIMLISIGKAAAPAHPSTRFGVDTSIVSFTP